MDDPTEYVSSKLYKHPQQDVHDRLGLVQMLPTLTSAVRDFVLLQRGTAIDVGLWGDAICNLSLSCRKHGIIVPYYHHKRPTIHLACILALAFGSFGVGADSHGMHQLRLFDVLDYQFTRYNSFIPESTRMRKIRKSSLFRFGINFVVILPQKRT